MAKSSGSNKIRIIISGIALLMIILAAFAYTKWQSGSATPVRQDQEIR